MKMVIRELEQKLAGKGIPEIQRKNLIGRIRGIRKKVPGNIVAVAYDLKDYNYVVVSKNGLLHVESNIDFIPEGFNYNSLSPKGIVYAFKMYHIKKRNQCKTARINISKKRERYSK